MGTSVLILFMLFKSENISLRAIEMTSKDIILKQLLLLSEYINRLEAKIQCTYKAIVLELSSRALSLDALSAHRTMQII